MTRTTSRKFTLTGAASLLALSLASGAAYAQEKDFDIEAQPLAKALLDFNEQSGLTVAAPRDLVADKRSPAVQGEMEPEEALEKILAGSGLKSTELPTGAYTITLASAEVTEPTPAPFRVAQLDQEEGVREVEPRNDEDEEARQDVIVVTGTNIRKSGPSASPIQEYTKEDIDLSGQLSVAEFIQTIPQNFTGELGESSLLSGNSGGSNIGNGSGANLRGLGADSTLVLINGRRLAPAGSGGFADTSLVPLAAVKRIDVLTDGASAIYGSDAVGGVVNIILQDDFDGAETSLRYGTVTDGGSNEYQASQIGGKSWGSGGGFFSYEFAKQNRLQSTERSFTEDALEFDLIPDTERHSFFASGNQDLSSALNVFATANYSVRDFEGTSEITTRLIEVDATTEQFGGTLGATVQIDENWQAEIVGLFSKTSLEATEVFPLLDASSESKDENESLSLEGKVDGPIFKVPGGNVRIAVGGGYRNEKYLDGVSDPTEQERDVAHAFGEVFVPIVGEHNSAAGVDRLELTAAVRFEDYSDFGSTTNPKLGLLWSPADGIALRSSYGTSFRAPRLPELSPGQNGAFYLPAVDPSDPSGSVLSLFLSGKTGMLDPEESETFTVGFDLAPEQFPGFSASVTYFDIEFENRIATPSVSPFTALVDPLFEPIVQRSPSLGDVDAILDSLDFLFNFSGLTDADARAATGVIIDGRIANFAVTEVDGLDFNVSYSKDTDIGTISVSSAGSYLFNFDERIFPTAPNSGVLNTFGNPIDLRLRNSLSWMNDEWTVAAFVNHATSYDDNLVTPERSIDAFTTIDLTLSYEFDGQRGSILNDTRFTVSATNLFDQDPPFVDQFRDVNFDPANASPVGRFISFQVTKTW